MHFYDEKEGISFEYDLVEKSRVKNLHIKILKNGKVQVIVPRLKLYGIGQGQVEKILREKSSFIQKAVDRYARLSKLYPDLFNFSLEHYKENKLQAQEIIQSKVDYYCRRYNFQYNKLTIRNQSTRWGSCSSNGNLNFNYKIIFLTSEERDYIVVHELCHLLEHNHSGRFWKLVEDILPEYKKAHKSIQLKA